MKTHVPGQASRNITERAEATQAYRELVAALANNSITRDDVIHSMEREHNAEVYELDHHHARDWTPGMMVAVCRDNIWGATVEGTTVRVFID